MRFLILSLFLTLTLLAQDRIDRLYHKIYNYLDRGVTSLDAWLASEENLTIKEPFSFRFYLDSINEEYQDSRFQFGVRAYVALPAAKNRLNLFIEDFRRRDDVDTNQKTNIANSIEQNDYQVGLQYLGSHFLRYRVGIKVRSFVPDPFVGVVAQKSISWRKSWVFFGARSLYFVKRHFDHRIFFDYNYRFDEDNLLAFSNSLRYEQKSTDHYQENHSLSLYHSLSRYALLSGTLNAYLSANKIDQMRLRYYYSGIEYTNRIFRPWFFYKISPGIIFRKENDFDPAWRLQLRFGVIFESH